MVVAKLHRVCTLMNKPLKINTSLYSVQEVDVFAMHENKVVQCIHCSAVKPAKPADILDGMRPIFDGGLMESICS